MTNDDGTASAPAQVIVGAASQDYPGWVRTQEDELEITCRDDWIALFQPGSLTHILAEHVWEHLTLAGARIAAGNCFAMLAPGGRVRCAVPDGNFPDAAYQRIVQVGGPGPADLPAASHKVVYTLDTLSDVFGSTGFEVVPLEWCDGDGRFHVTDWAECDGFIYRSARFDHRNRDGAICFASLIVDAVKPSSDTSSP